MEEVKKTIWSSKVFLYSLVVLIAIAAGVGIYYLVRGNSSSDGSTNTSSSESSYADYDGKIVEITSTDGKVEGQMAIAVDESETYPVMALYFMKVNDPLPKVAASATDLSDGYYYLTNHDSADKIREGNGSGNLGEVMCNTDATPDVLQMARERTTDTDIYLGCDAQTDPYHESTSFYVSYGTYLDENSFDYDRLISKDTLAIFDEGPFYKEDTDSEYGGWGADAETVIAEGEITAQYELIYTE